MERISIRKSVYPMQILNLERHIGPWIRYPAPLPFPLAEGEGQGSMPYKTFTVIILCLPLPTLPAGTSKFHLGAHQEDVGFVAVVIAAIDAEDRHVIGGETDGLGRVPVDAEREGVHISAVHA